MGNDNIADIMVIGGSQLYVLGKQLGTTNVLMWDNSGQLVKAMDISVLYDLNSLKEKLALLLPEGRPDHWLLRLLDEGLPLLAPRGVLLVELGAGQAPRALQLAAERGLAARTTRDLAGVERVLELRRSPRA